MSATPKAAAAAGAHLPSIDGLRGIAVLLVMQYHFWALPFSLYKRKPTLLLDDGVALVFGAGWIGVDLFFVLSGFLITGILLDVKGHGGYFRSFYARRTLRIMPVYFLFLAFVIFMIPLVPLFDDGFTVTSRTENLRNDQFWFWTYLVNIAASLQSIHIQPGFVNLHFWTLAVEEQFYLIWPLVVLVLNRQRLAITCVAMIVAAAMLRIALTDGFASGVFNTNASAILMPTKMDTLALGALIAIMIRAGKLDDAARYAPFILTATVIVVAVFFLKNEGFALHDRDAKRWGYTAVALLFASALVLVLKASSASLLSRVLTSPVLRAFGKYSYAMYVVHLLVSYELARQVVVNEWWRDVGGSQIPFNIVFSLAATALTFGVAWLSWHLLEGPLLTQKKRFQYSAPTRVAPASDTPMPAN